MVRRAQFKTKVNIDQEDMDKFMDRTMVKKGLDSNNPMVDLPVSDSFISFPCAVIDSHVLATMCLPQCACHNVLATMNTRSCVYALVCIHCSPFFPPCFPSD